MNLQRIFPIGVFQVSGTSMMPVLHHKQKVIGLQWFSALNEGEIIIAKVQNRPVIKRITKLDGQKLWVEGDNKNESTDSRTFGWIPRSKIIAKLIIKL